MYHRLFINGQSRAESLKTSRALVKNFSYRVSQNRLQVFGNFRLCASPFFPTFLGHTDVREPKKSPNLVYTFYPLRPVHKFTIIVT